MRNAQAVPRHPFPSCADPTARTTMIPLLTLLAVALGLTLDASIPGLGHAAADVAVATIFLLIYRQITREERRLLLACVVLATLGEVFLCFVWGLYDYRYGNLPVFVPLGHGIIFLAGCRLSQQVPSWTWRLVLALAAPAVILLAVTGLDTAGLLLFPVFLLCLLPRETRNLYAVMLATALLVELAGTAVGSWSWAGSMPVLGLTQTNPPLTGGVFYCLLDLFVIAQPSLRRSFASRAVSVIHKPDSKASVRRSSPLT
ncbi:MAG: hypothetical protein V2A76_12805 [Planctomycetota bacterium]